MTCIENEIMCCMFIFTEQKDHLPEHVFTEDEEKEII